MSIAATKATQEQPKPAQTAAEISEEQPVFEDNAQLVDDAFKRLKAGFKTGKTRKYEYRILQLKQLHKGFRTLSKELSTATSTDLGKNDFSNWLFELRFVEREIEHCLKHLRSWMEDEVVDTPLMLGPARSYL
mmetsp:Transcript_1469/g.2013  ORF Transcript_1469/g.2013 Transcript_1469/m.2013 type:complete len:133 (-) Transcript_1469:1330-1728(-)